MDRQLPDLSGRCLPAHVDVVVLFGTLIMCPNLVELISVLEVVENVAHNTHRQNKRKQSARKRLRILPTTVSSQIANEKLFSDKKDGLLDLN